MIGLDISVAVLQMLPKLIDLADRLVKEVDEQKLKSFMLGLEDTIDKAITAKTEGEKIEAAKAFVKAIRTIR
jgi:hypothetical protein